MSGSRHPSRHSGVSCDACSKGGFTGKRYKCLTCYDFDLCQDCYEAGETGNGRHEQHHPMQVILTKVEADLFYGGENHGVEQPQSFTCPLCGDVGLSDAELRDHVSRHHSDASSIQEVICPVCAAHPSGNPNHLTDDFPSHLTLDHSRSLRDVDLDQNSVHSRVRRMMVRRRGGLERHYGGLLRGDSGASQASPDSDPVSEILSHLAVGGRSRMPSEIPPHIQQLLDSQERQALERSATSRPAYRKILVGGGLPLTSSGAISLFAPSRDALELGSSSRSHSKSETLLASTTSSSNRENSAYLLPSCEQQTLSDAEKVEMEKLRIDRSLFVQDLLLSSLAFSDSSSESSEEAL